MNLLGKGQNPEFWSETVRSKDCYKTFLEDRLNIWKNDCENKPLIELSYNKFKMFKVNGNRNIYEDEYFLRRRCMDTAAVLAMVYPEEQKYLDYLMDILFAVLNEYTWCVPAHNSALEKNNNVYLDLFATETGFALAEIYTMLGDRLDPLIRDRIRVEINRRIFDSFFRGSDGNGQPFWWSTTCTNNWASVCIGSIGCTAMLMRPDLFDKLKPDLDRVMDNYLSGFGSDGYCVEGFHYWHYGYGFFVVYADMLRTFTNGKENYFANPKVKEIATFIQKMFLSGSAAVSFADGVIVGEYHLGLVHFLKNEYPDDIKVYSPAYSYIEDGCARCPLIMRSASWLDEDIYKNPASDSDPAEYYGEDSQWYVKRTENYGFAAKAGNNHEHHNHNDIGSFIYAKKQEQIFLDLGRGEYTKQYFRDETRFTIIECRSKGHSVPYFGNNEQKYGAQYKATDVKFKPGYFSMDMANAYELDGLRSLKREFALSDNKIVLTDTFDYNGDDVITERFVTKVLPIIGDGFITIDSTTLYFDKSICTPEILSDMTTTNYKIYFIDLHLIKGAKVFSATIA